MTQAFEVVEPSIVPTSTMIEFVLDETGSMMVCRDATIAGFNEYVNSQKNQPGECLITLTKFDSTGVRTQYTDMLVEDVEPLTPLTYKPNAWTNLYDAVGLRIRALEERAEHAKGPAVLMVIMTDGFDNKSTEFTVSSVKDMIEEKKKKGWTFVFMGANQDAWEVGQQFGLSKANTMTYSTGDVGGAMETLSAATHIYRSARTSGVVDSAEASTDFFAGDKLAKKDDDDKSGV